MFYVYILYSDKFDKYYIGQTNDIERRFFEHNNKETNSFTSKYRPWRLVTSLEFSSRSIAMKAEKYLKNKHRDFLNRVIQEKDLRAYIKERFKS